MEPHSSVIDRADNMTPSDADLVDAAQAGDADAIECLLARHYPWLVNLLAHQVRDAELAKDVAQDAMLAAAHQLGSLRDSAAFKPWLYRIAANQAYSARRRQYRRPVVSLDELVSHFPWRRELAIADPQIDRYGDREAVHDILDRLSESDRELLLLRFVAGFTGTDVARIFSISPEAARQRTARAIRRYQQRHAVGQAVLRAPSERESLA